MNNAFRKEPDAEKPHVRNSVRDTFGNGCIYSTQPNSSYNKCNKFNLSKFSTVPRATETIMHERNDKIMIYTCTYVSPLGDILLAADEIGLVGLWFEGQKCTTVPVKAAYGT